MLHHTNDMMECPKCGKHALVERSQDRYQCLWCDFHKNLSPSESAGSQLLWFALALLCLILLL
jgi:ribosomal protein S27AE